MRVAHLLSSRSRKNAQWVLGITERLKLSRRVFVSPCGCLGHSVDQDALNLPGHRARENSKLMYVEQKVR
jgi:hypothetical protein